MTKKSTKEEFIKKAISIYGDVYDYSKVEYVNSKTKVCIICPEHGGFWQRPTDHLSGRGCVKCPKDRVMVKMTPNQVILTAVYQTMYLNELVCLCVHDIKPSISKIDKESQKIYKAALRRVREYEAWMANIMSDSGNVYVDFNDTMDYTVQPFLEKFKDELYNCLDSHSNAEHPYVCTLVETARTITRFSITEIANRVKDTLKYDQSVVSLYTYQQKELMTILDNLTRWVFRKVNDINFNDYPNVVNAWVDVEKAINNSNTIGAAIVKAQQLNDKDNDIK